MVAEIAKKLYHRTEALGRFTHFKLRSGMKRAIMGRELEIIKEQVEALRDAVMEDGNYDEKYHNMIKRLFKELEMIDMGLCINNGKSRKSAAKTAAALHIFARPFFAEDDPLRASPDEAVVLHTKAWL